MSVRSHTVWRVASTLAAGTAIVATSVFVSRTARRINAASKLGVVDENTAESSFVESHTTLSYANPQNRASRVVDMHSVTLSVPLDKAISDETILAQATKNFFNGWVFYLEGKVLGVVKPEDSKYTKLASTTVPAHIWNAAELSEFALPELHTVLFGVFRLADIHLADVADKDSSSSTQSHADFLFGSDMTTFAGCHRLSVERQDVDAAEGTQKVKVQLQCYACNPQSDAPANSVVLGFHRLYASALFRETAGQIHLWLCAGGKATAS